MEWTASATLAQAVRAHRGEVTCLDACGGLLVSGSGDRALRLWRWTPGVGWEPAGEALAAHRYGVTTARWSHGGVLVASGGVDGAVRVWCGRSLAARRQLAAPGAAAVRALAWAGGGGARLAAGHDDGAVCVWAVPRGALLARLAAHEGAMHALVTMAQDALLLTACTHGVLKVFDLAEVVASGVAGEGGAAPAPLLWVDCAHDMGALCADASEDGGAAATGGHDARIRLWRAAPSSDGGGGRHAPFADAGTLEGHTAAVTALRWATRGTIVVLASASLDRSARLWAPDVGSCLQVVQAHPRYLTCVVLAPDLRYMITGSNDKSFRVWSLGAFSLDDELQPPCVPLDHFGLGDLEGIGPVEEDEDLLKVNPAESDAGDLPPEEEEGSGVTRVWSSRAHEGAINCIATCGDLLATASSDGMVKVWRWSEAEGALREEHALEGHRYPALAADFGAGGAVLLSAGLDGCAFLWDVESGVVLRSLVVPRGGEAGGGGVRGARVAPRRALLLLATDDGLAPLWSLTDPDAHPTHVYAGGEEAVTCCAWSADGRVAATGAAGGELRLLAPPAPAPLHHDSQAHDLGVLSCDFAPPSSSIELPEDSYLLATAGSDSLVKLWRIDVEEEFTRANVQLVRQVSAHGGAVAGVRWGVSGGAGGEALLATAGADAWARVWRVALDSGGARAAACGAAPVRGAGGALAAALGAAAGGPLLAVGTMAGELAVWRLAGAGEDADDDGAGPRFWGETGVVRWLRDYILYAPGSTVCRELAAAMESNVRAVHLTGARLLDDPIEDLLELGFGLESNSIPEGEEESAQTKEAALRMALCDRMRDELQWLRASPPPACVERAAPHALLCPLSHRLLREPARAADGFSYERANLQEWLCAAPPEGAVSPVSGRGLRSARAAPNYALRDTLRAFVRGAVAALQRTDP